MTFIFSGSEPRLLRIEMSADVSSVGLCPHPSFTRGCACVSSLYDVDLWRGALYLTFYLTI